MNLLQVALLGVGLAADALAVSVAEGIALHRVPHGHTVRVALHFGAFQGIMPVLGWLAGRTVQPLIASFDHWIAFALLGAIGGKMLIDSLTGFETGEPRAPSRGGRLLLLSLATSVDALAVGLTLALLDVRIWEAALVIGLITAALCAMGIQAGDRIGTRLGRWSERVGGAILVVIGAHILFHHLWA